MYFKQTFNNDTYKQYWSAAGAKQVWYFSKFFVDFNSFTYMYQDKILRATFADGTSGLEITGAKCVAPTGTTQLTAKLTKVDGSTYDLQRHDKLTWKSSDESIVKVNSSGLVTAVASTGQATITAHFKDAGQSLDESADATIQVGTGATCTNPDPGNPDPGNPGGDNGSSGVCTISIETPSKGNVTAHTVMDPIATGMVKADDRDSEKFNVLDGIPTSESLYVNVFGLNYLFQNKWANMTGEVTYTVPVKKKYILTWTIPGRPGTKTTPPVAPIPRQREVPVTENITVKRNYSYWQIDNLEVYKLARTTINNYALPNESVTLNPNAYSAPMLTSDHSERVNEHVQPFACKGQDLGTATVPGGDSEPSVPTERSLFTSTAESHVGENKVKNDHVVFNGNTIMSNSWVDRTAPTPGIIPSPTTIQRDVLYGKNYMIRNTLLNKVNTPSTGAIFYDLIPNNIKGGANKTYPVHGLNPVTVHTPTVNYSNATDDAAHNQKTRPNFSRRAFILDRPFAIHIPTTGQHRNILGYGNRDYAKYIKEKQVKFEFDVYSADRSAFYPKDTWISIPVRDPETIFYLPVWVDEGDYTIHFRSFAENAPSDALTQEDANFDLINYVATDTVPVEVIGRVYDFRITDIVDMNWELAFRQQKKSKEHTGRYYWVGTHDIDGNLRGNETRYTLPIRRGSHPNDGFKNVTVKPGYHFKFDLKTKGNMFEPNDFIRITPTFEFVSRDGKHRQDVDLYYHAPDRNFVRIGSSFDTIEREITLNARLRNLHPLQIEQTGRTFYQLYRHQLSQSEQLFMQQWLRQVDRPTKTGGFSHMKMPGELRLFRGPTQIPNGVNAYRAYAAEQQWYGEFGIPSKVYIVQKGFPLHRQFSFREDASFFLKDGYIVVNFNIETIRAGRINDPHLQYINAPLTNQWRREGFVHSVTDPYGATFQLKDGDIMFYDAAQSSRDDYRVGGTH
ncbi:Ig-like domain-containing protein [Paenibacillus agilis]|uniref:Ig-like domain-containing protein n=1 Tax=Paenibacillus agilis TaxID=3020863 RepID=A0A559IIF6_9BACL|nr:Ig-like domain-containing protein [Paenibacillus agilis]